MVVIKLFFVLIVSFYIFLTIDAEGLVLTHVLYRHGDRAPIKLYPNDPYNDTSRYWPDGLGELTKTGKQMEYALGRWLRNRYNTLVSAKFNEKEVYIRSTDFDRTLMSAQCVLASFYYPDDSIRFNDSLAWVPTPIHTSPIPEDELLMVQVSCPRINNETTKHDKSKYMQDFMNEHRALMEVFSEGSGFKIETIRGASYLYDTLMIESLYNLTLPTWTDGWMDEMKVVSDFGFGSTTPELNRLYSGPLLKEISSHMINKSEGKLNDSKLFMYSAHDTTVAYFLNSLEVFNSKAPPYAATVLVELHQNSGDYFVKIFYQNDSNMQNEPHLLTLPTCEPECPLKNFTQIVEKVIPYDWSSECGKEDYNLHLFYLEIFSGFSLAVLIILIFLLAMECKYGCFANAMVTRRSDQKYFLVPDLET